MSGNRNVLALFASSTVDVNQVNILASTHGYTQVNLTVATNSGNITEQQIAGQFLDAILSTGPSVHHSVQLLGTIAKALHPGGQLTIIESGTSVEDLCKRLLLSGLPGATPSSSSNDIAAAVQATKPTWDTGVRAAISLKKKTPKAETTWKISLNDNNDGDKDDELVDEDALLTEEDHAQRPTITADNAAAADDCEVGASGKKACKNCTCGRAEGKMEEVKLTREMLENPKTGGCGSCGLGDAFRCAGCPYKGLPSFEEGKPIQLPPDFLAIDV